MLKHEDNLDTLSQSAAQVRVTPEELATAVSRIEARKDTDQRRADGTIPIGEAVQQLGLGVTPEEVLAEVQAARAQQAARKKSPSPHRRLALLTGIGLGVLGLVGWWSVPHTTQSPAPPAVTLSVPQEAPKHILLDPNLLVGDASGKLVMLSEIGENQPVECYYDYGNGSFQPYSPHDSRFAWTLIKHGGQVYVRGGMPRMSEQARQKNGTDVTWDAEANPPVTLPLNGFQVMAGEGDEKEGFHAVNIHLDKHAYEKWKP